MVMKVMSFNIRYGIADDGENRWEQRKALVIERIMDFEPDLIGMQECRDDEQAEYVRNRLGGWKFLGVPRGGGDQTSLEMAPVLYRESSFNLIERGCFWLSETPQVAGSKSWASTFARTATWARLLHIPSSREMVFLNTHFDYHPAAIDAAARLLKHWADKTLQEYPLIVTGDFNADKNSAAYACLTGDGRLRDIYRQVHPGGEGEATFHGFGQPGAESAIDWVLASEHFEVLSATIDRCQPEGRYPSDHYPLKAELLLKETETEPRS